MIKKIVLVAATVLIELAGRLVIKAFDKDGDKKVCQAEFEAFFGEKLHKWLK